MSPGAAVANIGHSTKKHVTRATTSKAALNAGLNQEFVDTRSRLNDISTSLQHLHTQILESRQVWNAVARSQRDFSRRLSSSFAQQGAVQAHAAEVERVLRNVQRELIESDASGGTSGSTDLVEAGGRAAHLRIADVLQRYVENVESIQTEYRAVEMTYTEKARYEQKVDKLERRSTSARNKDGGERLRRNMQKLDGVQAELDAKMEGILTRMRDAWQKHEAVLQCAHHAFWCANNMYMSTVGKATHAIREESQTAHSVLLGLELHEGRKLLPIERRYTTESATSLPAPGAMTEQKAIPAPGHVADSVVPAGTDAVTLSQGEGDLMMVPKARFGSESGSQSSIAEDFVPLIPDVPTEKPSEPSKMSNITPATMSAPFISV